jgi:hypothetical protein
MEDSDLKKIENLFHQLIIERSAIFRVTEQVLYETVKLPVIDKTIINLEDQYIGIPGMIGGFSYLLQVINGEYRLLVQSWSRVCFGSEQTHLITKNNCILVEDGLDL